MFSLCENLLLRLGAPSELAMQAEDVKRSALTIDIDQDEVDSTSAGGTLSKPGSAVNLTAQQEETDKPEVKPQDAEEDLIFHERPSEAVSPPLGALSGGTSEVKSPDTRTSRTGSAGGPSLVGLGR